MPELVVRQNWQIAYPLIRYSPMDHYGQELSITRTPGLDFQELCQTIDVLRTGRTSDKSLRTLDNTVFHFEADVLYAIQLQNLHYSNHDISRTVRSSLAQKDLIMLVPKARH